MWATAYVIVAGSSVISLGSAFRTNDDAAMLASVSGFTGGSPRPELILTHVGIGAGLRHLYAISDGIPWYGLYLHLLLGIAVIAATASVVQLSRRPSGATVSAVGAAVLAFVVVETTSIQFTVVSIMLSGAGVLTWMALRDVGLRPLAAATIGGIIALLGLAVRLQGFLLGVLIVGSAVVLRTIATGHWDRRGTSTLTLILLLGGSLLLGSEALWWRLVTDSPRSYGVLDPGLRDHEDVFAASTEGRFSENDRVLITEDWMIFPDEQFAYPTEVTSSAQSGRDAADVSQAEGRSITAGAAAVVRSIRDAIGVESLLRLGSEERNIAWFVLCLLIAAAGTTRRARFAAFGMTAIGVGLLMVVGSTRLPDRVSGPSWILLLLAVLVVGQASPRAADASASRLSGWAAVASALVPALLLLGTAVDRSSAHEARQARAQQFISDLIGLGGADATYALWLIDPWVVVDPLDGSGPSKYRITTVEVGGWASTLPYYRGMREQGGLDDWIDAVATDDGVLLVASAERLERFQILLRERRGMLCTEPEVLGVVNGGFDLLVRKVPEVPCAGTVIAR